MKVPALLALLLISIPSLAQKPVPSAPAKNSMNVVGYFPQWGVYSNFFLKNLLTSGSAPLLTQINYAFANVVNSQCQSFDPWADFEVPFPARFAVNGQADSQDPEAFVGNFHQLQELKQIYPNLKVVLSIGGAGANPAEFSTAAAPQNRQAFVASCIDMYIQGNFAPWLQEPGIIDGLDIDWEFPGAADKQNFTALLAEFRRQLDAVRPGLTLTIAAPPGSWAYDNIELPKVQRYLDFFGVMTYDYDGPWLSQTGFVAPLFQSPTDPDPTNNADATMRGYLRAGVHPDKMVFGIPFYGYQWSGVPDVNHGLFKPGTPADGAPYNYIVTIEGGFSKYRDPVTRAPWLYDGTTFWTYDDPVSIKFKMGYVRSHGLAGVMVWELSNDLPNGTLLKTIVRGLDSE